MSAERKDRTSFPQPQALRQKLQGHWSRNGQRAGIEEVVRRQRWQAGATAFHRPASMWEGLVQDRLSLHDSHEVMCKTWDVFLRPADDTHDSTVSTGRRSEVSG